MKRLKSTILEAGIVGLAATKNYDFDVPAGASGVYIEVKSSNPSSMSFTYSLQQLFEDGTARTLVTSAAVSTAVTTAVAAVPGVTAVANVIANDVMLPKARLALTRSTGSADFRIIVHFYGAGNTLV